MKNAIIIQENSNRNEYYTVEDYMFNNRELLLDEEVNSSTMTSLINQVRYLDKISPGEEITLFINSPGGEVTSGLVLFDVLRMAKSPIRTVCIGTAASMGAIIFLAGDKRCMTEHSQIMIHDPSVKMGNMPSKALAVQETLESLMNTRRDLARIIADRTGKPIRSVYSKTKGDSYFSAKEALEFGLATEIINEL